ncbi:MAG: hypothetical protein ACPL3P_07865, partial [Anaerolineales bacterium]
MPITPLIPSAGLYHFSGIPISPSATIHLRVEKDGNSTLIINANTILHLNNSATIMAYSYLNKLDEKEVIKQIAHLYRGKISNIDKDYCEFVNSIETILANGYVCFSEIHNLDTEYPFQQIPQAPFRMDLALTYACNNDCYHCYNDPARSTTHLSSTQWKTVIDKLREIGI